MCRACETGHFQASGAKEVCDPCPAGTYQNETGSIACKRCPFGQYQDTKGSTQCKRCVAGSTTPFLGATSLSDCGCEEGSINVNASREALKCIPCGEGLACPFSSSLEALQSGNLALTKYNAMRCDSRIFHAILLHHTVGICFLVPGLLFILIFSQPNLRTILRR